MKYSLGILMSCLLVACSCTSMRSTGIMTFKDVKQTSRNAVTTSVDGATWLRLNVEVEDAIVNALVDQIENPGEAKSIVIEIDSPGGSVTAGFKLSKAIEKSTIPVHCIVDGEAASMAFYILQSCHTRSMTRRSVLMAHHAALYGNMGGDSDLWQNQADYLKALDAAMVEHCARRLDISTAELESKITGARQYWMTWEEAVKIGAVDSTYYSVRDIIF